MDFKALAEQGKEVRREVDVPAALVATPKAKIVFDGARKQLEQEAAQAGCRLVKVRRRQHHGSGKCLLVAKVVKDAAAKRTEAQPAAKE